MAPTRKSVVIGADHPQRRRRLHHPAAGGEPGAREVIVGRKARELVPVVVDGVDMAVVRTLEVALELEVVGRIGKNEIDGSRCEMRQAGDAVADHDAMVFRGFRGQSGRPAGRPVTRHTHDSGL